MDKQFITNTSEELVRRGFPAIGEQLTADEIRAMHIGTPFYVVKNNVAFLSMFMGVNGQGLATVAQATAGRVVFGLNSLGKKVECYKSKFSEEALSAMFNTQMGGETV